MTISRGSKFYLLLLQELGLTTDKEGNNILQMEYPVANGLIESDFYISGDLDMVIDVHGPSHFKNLTMEPMDSMLYIDRIIRRYHKHYLIIPYTFFDSYMKEGMQEDLSKPAEILKKMIDGEMSKI